MAKGNPKIELRLDAATRARWEAVAKAEGLSLSEWIRRAAEAWLAGPRVPPGHSSTAPSFIERSPGKVFRGPDPKVKGK